jgi:hypothetical protein
LTIGNSPKSLHPQKKNILKIFYFGKISPVKKKAVPIPTLVLHIIKMVKFIPQKIPSPHFPSLFL